MLDVKNIHAYSSIQGSPKVGMQFWSGHGVLLLFYFWFIDYVHVFMLQVLRMIFGPHMDIDAKWNLCATDILST